MTKQTYAVVLAAGTSSRFGRGKMIEEINGKPLVCYSLHSAQAACPGRVVLVTGANAEEVNEVAGDLADHRVFNPDFALGLGTSIAAGVSVVEDTADAVLLLLGDQPLVDKELLNEILHTWSGRADEIVVTDYGAASGPPALFPRNSFGALCNLTGDEGAKSVVNDGTFEVKKVHCPDAGIDIDTEVDAQSVRDKLS